MCWRRLLALASMSSSTIVKIDWLQPRMTVWPSSMTRERPLRSSSRRPSIPVEMMPMRIATMKMPPIVISSIASRKPGRPVSPPIVPESRVRSRLIHAMSRKPRSFRSIAPLISPRMVSTNETPRMSSAETTNSPRIRATVPRAMNASNR